MKIIDAHLHFSKIESFRRTAEELSFVDYSSKGLIKEFTENGIIAGIAMGVTEKSHGGFPDNDSENPMKADLENSLPQNLLYCIGINPQKLKGNEAQNQLTAIENELKNSSVAGIKIYAGYYYYHVHDPIYESIYDLAAYYKTPVVIHCGDTYSERGMLKYSHPLNIDELAVTHRSVNFMICHLGDPWVMDTAEIIRKNYNVYADLSGLIVGDSKQIARYRNEQLFVEHIKRSLAYADNYEKLLFGSDWPLVPLKPYLDFIQYLIPEKYHEQVFYRNATTLFPKLKA